MAETNSHSQGSTAPPPPVYENPYYPLEGPPRTPEEHELLKSWIRTEREAVNAQVRTKLGTGSTSSLDEMAMANCADVRWQALQCLRGRSWIGRFTNFCLQEQQRITECVEGQTKHLKALGYHKLGKGATERERMLVANAADRLFLEEMKQKRLKEMQANLDSPKQ